MSGCTAECLDRQAEREREHSEFIAKYPLYCRMCGGMGIEFWLEDQSPFGSGVEMMMEMEDICSACVDCGSCPLCAGWLDESGWCVDETCLYDPEIDDHPAAPPVYECMCWYKEGNMIYD